jgi:hypothetical protein
MSQATDSVAFMKAAIALGLLTKADAKRCLKGARAAGVDAAELAEGLGLLSAEDRERVSGKLERARRRKRKRERARAESSAEVQRLTRSDCASGSASDVGGSDSDEAVAATLVTVPVADDQAEDVAATQVTTAADDEPAALGTAAQDAGPGDTDDDAAEARDDDASDASAGELVAAGAAPVVAWLRRQRTRLILCGLAAVSGTLTGVGAVQLGGFGQREPAPRVATVDPAPSASAPAPAQDPEVIDLSEDDDLGPDPIPSAPGESGSMTRSATRTPPPSTSTADQPAAAESVAVRPSAEPARATSKPASAAPAKASAPRASAPAKAKAAPVKETAEPAEAPEKTRTKTKVEKPKAKEVLQPQRLLLGLAFAAFQQTKTKTVGKLADQIAELGSDLPEAHASRGLHHFLLGDYPAAVRELKLAGDVGPQGRLALARALLFSGQQAEAVAAMGPAERASPEGRRIVQLVEGPFKTKYPHAAAALEAITDGGHYRVVTDLGLDLSDLRALEGKLKAADPEDRDKLVARYRKKHKGLAELCETMDKAYKAYDKLFAIDRRSEIVPTVYVFSERAMFDGYSKQLEVGATEHTLGYYLPHYRVLVFYDLSKPGAKSKRGPLLSQATLEVLLHETFHQWIHLYTRAPHWFNEGMAEYFGIAEMGRKELRYGLIPKRHPSRLSNIRDALRGKGAAPLPLEVLIQADRKEFMDPERAAVNYAASWSFVHFLASNKKGRKLLRAYFHALRDGKSRKDAYEEVFGGIDMVALEKDWEAYVFSL